MSKVNIPNQEPIWKVYQITDENNQRSFLIINDIDGNAENYLELGQEIETSVDFETLFGTDNVKIIKNW